MLVYMNCSLFKRGSYWVFRDDVLKVDFAKFTNCQFFTKDFRGDYKVNEFEIIREYRDKHPLPPI